MKKCFRFAALLLALLMIFPFGVFAEAADEAPLEVFIPVVQGASGKEVTVTVSVQNAFEMDSLQFRLNYDLSCVKLQKAEIGELLSDSGLYVINTDEEGLVVLAFACAEGLARTKGDVLTLTFKPYNDCGSALTLSAVYASRYNTGKGQTKAYVSVTDGGVCFGKNGNVPEAVITPWPVETPAPTPSPTPSPTPLPTATPSPTPEPTPEPTPATFMNKVRDKLTAAGFSDPNALFPILMLMAAILLIVVTIIIILVRRKSETRRAEEKRDAKKKNYDE